MYEQEAEDIVQEALQNALDNGYDFSNMDLWAIINDLRDCHDEVYNIPIYIVSKIVSDWMYLRYGSY
jgi:hypothetical protein